MLGKLDIYKQKNEIGPLKHTRTKPSKEIEEVKWSQVTQSCPTLCDPMDRSLRGSSIQGIIKARILEWIAISFSK